MSLNLSGFYRSFVDGQQLLSEFLLSSSSLFPKSMSCHPVPLLQAEAHRTTSWLTSFVKARRYDGRSQGRLTSRPTFKNPTPGWTLGWRLPLSFPSTLKLSRNTSAAFLSGQAGYVLHISNILCTHLPRTLRRNCVQPVSWNRSSLALKFAFLLNNAKLSSLLTAWLVTAADFLPVLVPGTVRFWFTHAICSWLEKFTMAVYICTKRDLSFRRVPLHCIWEACCPR